MLIDGRPKRFTDACKAAELSPCAPPSAITLVSPPHIAAEIRGIAESEASAPDPSDLGDLPITVLAATKPPLGAPDGGQAFWLRVQREFAEALRRGRYLVAKGSEHYIHKDNPDLLVKETHRMLKLTRRH